MSKEPVSTKLSDGTQSSFEDYCTERGVSNYRGAERLIEDGLRSNGYGVGRETRLSRVADEGMRFGAYGALVALGLNLTLPVSLTSVVAGLLAATLVMGAIERTEPSLTDRVTNRRRVALADGGEK